MEQQTKTSARALGAAPKPRQLTMMGLGSAIGAGLFIGSGAGLFIGSGAGIQAAGPAVLISYLVAGTLIILVMWALGEMAAANPDSGAFSVYTAKAYGPVAGATVGWLWWLQLVVVIAAEALGAAGLLATIFPALPVWLMAFVFIVVLTAVNLTNVKNFGEFEFWFALLKVAAIVGFLLVGAALLFGWLPGVQSPGLANFAGEGFAPSGFAGIATALFVVAFAFGGTEIVSVVAAETAEPARSVKKAVRTVLWRILVFYIGAIFIIAAVVPVGSEGLKSPFAAVLEAAGMPGAATTITLVAVAALLSALNANLYGASRMAYSLAERGEAPRVLAAVSKARVPVVAVLASVAFGVVTVVLELAFPEMVLGVLLNIVGSTCLLVWTSALLAQLALRLRADREGTALPLRMPGFLWLTCFGLVILAAIFTVGFIGEDSRPQLLSTFALVALLAVANWLHHRGGRKVAPAAEPSDGAKQSVLLD
ncbi:amino acid permease [Arthrobacter sp. FW306-07-I]|uniref:amino acid permease n=1 Tax=Arthrobacter sp. FW306-07-I TaxID=2879622 RepID=UPI001F3E4997|nr:amino acid permease [Arthrobacter sp. FW306-07-I]UKA76464.1 amino acid permease [Arthrobacter sp. FW306-07-I]